MPSTRALSVSEGFVAYLPIFSLTYVCKGWVSATLGQSPEKKAVSLSIVNVVANASYIYTPYLYGKDDGPRYLTAMASNAGFAFATIAAAWGLKFWLKSTNRNLRRADASQTMFYAY